MTKHNGEKIVVAIAIAFLSHTSPLLLAGNAWAQTPIDMEVKGAIAKLKSSDRRKQNPAIEKLVEIGSQLFPLSSQPWGIKIRYSARVRAKFYRKLVPPQFLP